MSLDEKFRSKLLRRSGISAALICDHIGFAPDCMYQIGIGMNHGELDVFTQVWEGLKLFGCEPHPQILRGLRDVYPGTLYEVAVSDHVGKATLYSKPRHKDGSSLMPHTTCTNDRQYTVEVTTIDTLWPDGPVGQHPILWVDCEGSELKALNGGVKFVEKVEVINVEMTSKEMGTGWCRPEEVHQWLLGHGFRRQWVHTQRAWVGQVDAIYVRPHLFQAHICCCPCEMMRKDI